MYFSVPCVLVNKGFRANITFVNNSKRKKPKNKKLFREKGKWYFSIYVFSHCEKLSSAALLKYVWYLKD